MRYVSYGESLVQLAASIRRIMALDGVDRTIMHPRVAKSEALMSVFEKDHIEKTLPGLEAVYLRILPWRTSITHAATCVPLAIFTGRDVMSDPKVKFPKLMPQRDGTKVRCAKKRRVP